MLKKIGLLVLVFLTGCIVGGIIVMACYGYRLSRGMFVLQDMDIVRSENTATEAYLSELPEIGIWALNNHLDFFDDVIEQRTAGGDEAENVFIFMEPKLRWLSHVRLGLLYEEIGNEEKSDESFRKAAELFGPELEPGKYDEKMVKIVKEWDKHLESKQE